MTNVTVSIGTITVNAATNQLTVPISVSFNNNNPTLANVVAIAVKDEVIGTPAVGTAPAAASQFSSTNTQVQYSANPQNINPRITVGGPGNYIVHAMAIDDTLNTGNGGHHARPFGY